MKAEGQRRTAIELGSLCPPVDSDLSEGVPFCRPHKTTKARIFVDVAEAVRFAEHVRKRHRWAGDRYSVRVYPRGLRVDKLSLSVWVVVQRDLVRKERINEGVIPDRDTKETT